MDTKKTKRVKLRGGPIITVSQQIFNWRAKIRKLEVARAELKTLYNAPGCPINDEQESPKVTLPDPWKMFK